MERTKAPPYTPRKIDPADLRTPLEGPLKDLPHEVWGELHQRRAALVDRLHPLGHAGRRILLKRAARAALAAVLVTWLLTPVGLDRWWAILPVALVYGAAMAWWRFSLLPSGGLLAGLGFVLIKVSGCRPAMLDGVLAIVCFFVGGAIVGVAEDLAASDGD